MPIEEFIISVFCTVESYYQKVVTGQLRQRGSATKLSASGQEPLWHFLRRVTRKILAHTVPLTINKTINPLNPLQFERLII